METKEKIIQKASDLFMKYGVRSVTMDDICRELAISKKTIYQYFKDKDDVVSQSAAMLIEEDKTDFFGIREAASNSIEELVLISKCIRMKLVDMNPTLLYDLQKYHHHAWQLFREYKETVMVNFIAESLRQGIKEGYFRDSLDPDTIARFRFETVQMVFNDEIFPKDKYDFREVQIQLFDHFVEGIMTDKGRVLYKEYMTKMTENPQLKTT